QHSTLFVPEPRSSEFTLPPETGDEVQPSVKSAARTAAVWIVVGFGTMYLLKFFSSVILTHQLDPEVFGLMILVTTFLTGLHMFSDVGIGQAVFQSPKGDEPDFLNTAWTLQILRGLAIWLGAVLIAWPVAVFYDESPALPVASGVGLLASPPGW